MANPHSPNSLVSFSSSEQRGTDMEDANLALQPPLGRQNRCSSDGPVAILWDIENCPVPSNVRPEDVAGNIRMALRVRPISNGAVLTFSAYGDFNAFPRRLREGCQRTGVKLVDVPNGRKDAADKAILVDMFLFALDNPPPSSIMLISGDVDFAPALHILGQRGYTIILVIPSGVGVSSALRNAGKFVWDWPSVARGEGFVPPARAVTTPRGGQCDTTGYFMGGHITEYQDCTNEEETIEYRGVSQSYRNSRDYSSISQSLTKHNSTTIGMPGFASTSRSHSLPICLNEVAAGGPISFADQNDSISFVQPGDLNGLKGQLVKLLELSGGCLPLIRVPAEYQKVFGRPLYVSEYGVFKLVDLFKKMNDAMAVERKGQEKFVYLCNWKAGHNAPALVLTKKDKKGKGPEEANDPIVGAGSSDEVSDEDQLECEERSVQGKTAATAARVRLYRRPTTAHRPPPLVARLRHLRSPASATTRHHRSTASTTAHHHRSLASTTAQRSPPPSPPPPPPPSPVIGLHHRSLATTACWPSIVAAAAHCRQSPASTIARRPPSPPVTGLHCHHRSRASTTARRPPIATTSHPPPPPLIGRRRSLRRSPARRLPKKK